MFFQVSGGSISVGACHSSSKGKSAACSVRPASRIPQVDGPIPYDDDVLSTPNVGTDTDIFSPSLFKECDGHLYICQAPCIEYSFILHYLHTLINCNYLFSFHIFFLSTISCLQGFRICCADFFTDLFIILVLYLLAFRLYFELLLVAQFERKGPLDVRRSFW